MPDWSPIDGERFLKTIVDSMPGMIAYWDSSLRCRFANSAYTQWFGREPQSLIGTTIQQLMGPKLFALNEPYIRGALAGQRQCFERTLRRADGTIGFTLANYIPDIDASGAVAGFYVLVSDVTQLKEAQADLRLAASVYESTIEGIIVTDADGAIVSVNPAFTKITGYEAAEAVGRTPRMLKSNQHDDAFFQAFWRDLLKHGRWQGEMWNRRKNGEAFLVWLTVSQIRSSADESARYVAVFNDITGSWRRNDRIRHLAFHDSLTDLPNRALLLDRLAYQLAMAERSESQVAVLFTDLDRFKAVNDTFGHAAGDALLKAVAQRLQMIVRRTDTVARLGGDEFVISLSHAGDDEAVTQTALDIIASINEPFRIEGKEIHVGISVGIATYPLHGRTPAELLANADQAMYAAKSAGKGTYRVYSAQP
jgi:diguanylate cyclase (GGDEF)-like protein/PAS domain S-box-containing protein